MKSITTQKACFDSNYVCFCKKAAVRNCSMAWTSADIYSIASVFISTYVISMDPCCFKFSTYLHGYQYPVRYNFRFEPYLYLFTTAAQCKGETFCHNEEPNKSHTGSGLRC
jgi:hypothetical protein